MHFFISNEVIESSVDSDPKSNEDLDLDESGESRVGGVITIKSESSWRSPEVSLTSTSELCSSKYLFHASETFCANSAICSSRRALSDCRGITDGGGKECQSFFFYYS